MTLACSMPPPSSAAAVQVAALDLTDPEHDPSGAGGGPEVVAGAGVGATAAGASVGADPTGQVCHHGSLYLISCGPDKHDLGVDRLLLLHFRPMQPRLLLQPGSRHRRRREPPGSARASTSWPQGHRRQMALAVSRTAAPRRLVR